MKNFLMAVQQDDVLSGCFVTQAYLLSSGERGKKLKELHDAIFTISSLNTLHTQVPSAATVFFFRYCLLCMNSI